MGSQSGRFSGLTLSITFPSSIFKDYVGPGRFDFSQGFLIFTAKHLALEIWRRASDIHAGSSPLYSRGRLVTTPVQFPSPAAVRDFQVQAAALASVEKDSPRGHFVPHAYVHSSTDRGAVRIFSANFPLLAFISYLDVNFVSVIDIASQELLWRFSIGPGYVIRSMQRYPLPQLDVPITLYMELSKEHLCLCQHKAVLIYRLPKHCTSQHTSLAANMIEARVDELVLNDTDTHVARQATAYQLRPSPSGTRGLATFPSTSHLTLPTIATVRGHDVLERYSIVRPSEDAQRAAMHALMLADVPRPEPAFLDGMYCLDLQHRLKAYFAISSILPRRQTPRCCDRP